MNCNDAERLFDAYLDGQLSGTLRLEFDAHRLRCRRCQQTLAMLESCGHVLASDRREPALALDFTERVMGAIERRADRRQAQQRRRVWRVALVAVGLLQAAAVLALAVIWHNRSDEPRTPYDVSQPPVIAGRTAPAPSSEADLAAIDARADQLREMIYAQLDSKLRQMALAKENINEQTRRLMMYLNIDVPDPLARSAADPLHLNPFTGWLDALLPGAPQAGEPAADADDGAFAL